MRRRRIVVVLITLAAAALVGAIGSGAAAGWWALLAVVAAGSGYLVLWHHVRRVLAEHEFAALVSRPQRDPFASPEIRLASTDAANEVGALQPARIGSQTWALARFVLANLAGWALSPAVFALTLLLGRTPLDTTGQRWLANLQTAQERLREQSLRTLAISAATTASVTAAGTVAVLTGAGAASAATLPATATLPAGMPLPGALPAATYRVAAGDTLGSIAARFGTTVGALAALNHLSNPNLIFVGQVLRLSGSGRAVTTGGSAPSWGAPAGATYRVVAGDTLGSIAARFGTTVGALAALNHLSDPNLIFVGQVLRVNGSSGGAAPTPTGPGGAAGATYRVASGDTLGSIAARFGTTVGTLAAINHLSNPNLIFVGQLLRISGSDGGAAPAAARAPAPAPAPATSAAGVAVRVALEQVGKPYQWAGAGPGSFDCSGLVMYAWGHAGMALPHYTVAQYEDTTRIGAGQLQPGDLVFYDTGSGAEPGHVTIYIGNGRIVTADSPGTVVRVEVVDWDGTPMGYGRVR